MRALRRLVHVTFLVVLALALATAVALGGLWSWSGSEGSLATAAQLAVRLLPNLIQDQMEPVLVLQGVTGTVREGGTVALVRWQRGAQTVEVQNLRVQWDWRALRDGRLHLPVLKAQSVRLEDTGTTQSPPLVEFRWPMPVDMTLDVASLVWAGPPALTLQDVQGHYVFDGETHLWDLTHVQIASGTYAAKGRLQASAPMALSARLSGTVRAVVPGGANSDLQATAQIDGTLSAPDATLNVAADLSAQVAQGQPGSGASARAANVRNASNSVRARLQAQLRPWQAQPVVRVSADWAGVDTSLLWPQAPRTDLDGRVAVLPDGGGWKARANVRNAHAGPWDQQRLPVQSLEAVVDYRAGQWRVDSLQASLAGGVLKAHGGLSADQTTWSVDTELHGVETARIDSRLPGVAIHGTANARQTRSGVDFDVQWQGAPATGGQSAAASTWPLRFKNLDVKGNWNGPQWRLDHALLQAQEASLQGPLRFNTRTWDAEGQLHASMPGAEVALEGALGAQQGRGSLRWQMQDANLLLRWLRRLPLGAEVFMAGLPEVQGAATLDAHWQGGWQKQGTQMRMDATLQSDHVTVGATEGQGVDAPLEIRALTANLGGTLQAMELRVHAQVQTGSQSVQVQSHARGGLVRQGQFEATLDGLQLDFKDPQTGTQWAAQLAQGVALQWRYGTTLDSFELAPGALRLTGPTPGTARIEWQAARWARSVAAVNKAAKGVPAQTPAVWHTQGRLQGLPLAWLELLGQTRLSNLGLRGDIVFGGSWEASGSAHLQLQASLERTSGDLQLLSADQAGGLLRAGLRDARVELQVDDAAVSAKLGWSSDGAGNASAEFHSRLEKTPAGWSWAVDAPVQASIHTNLPRVGVWSLLAPPGWRMQGTLESNLALSGSRTEPHWSGTIAAQDMSIRSVVDGIDFSQGVLRLKLDGLQMQVQEFSLKGAGGDNGGLLKASGLVLWLPGKPGGTLASRLRMNLEVVAQALRVSARADQRLVVSGHLSARLEDARLSLRGALVADQAMFVLPDDTTPQLSADVRVRPSVKAKQSAAGSEPQGGPKPSALALDIDVTLDPGSNFQLKGQGLDTRLEGKLNLRAEGKGGGPRLTGELRTVQGSYKAYGQTLNIEQGVLRFSGAYDNPALDILALRPQLQQTVGVQISGTVKLPVVRLYSDPDMADLDKLSWLVLGRAPSTTGTDYGLLQSAALALLSGKGDSPTGTLFKNLGLDEVSLGETSTTNPDGSTGTAATTVKLGKRISRDFYVAYERSIATTLGTFYVFYDLSRRFTLRAESGATTAVDLIFTTRFD